MGFRILLFVAFLSALRPLCLCCAQDTQKRAEELMQHARQLSDIRSSNAPAFRLKATFSLVGTDLKTTHGTYTEIWLSDSQWRRETVVNIIHRIEVGTADRIWRLDNSTDFPESAARLPELMNVFPQPSRTFQFESITDVEDQKIAEQCATTRPGPQNEKYRFCFDQKSGALLAKLSPQFRPKMTDYSCFYGIFRKFGSSWFPHEMACFENKQRKVEAQVIELSTESSANPSLFIPPPAAIELGKCIGTLSHPVAAPLNPEPDLPKDTKQNSFVVLSMIVDTQGKTQDVQVTQSGGAGFNEQAVKTVQKWRFTPGTCDGKPIPTEIRVEVDFTYW